MIASGLFVSAAIMLPTDTSPMPQYPLTVPPGYTVKVDSAFRVWHEDGTSTLVDSGTFDLCSIGRNMIEYDLTTNQFKVYKACPYRAMFEDDFE